jgi:hypothetical protein
VGAAVGVIVRIVLWRLDASVLSFEALRDRLGELEPLDEPSTLLVNEAAERLGAVVVSHEDAPPPAQLDALRAIIGRDPDLYEEFDTL